MSGKHHIVKLLQAERKVADSRCWLWSCVVIAWLAMSLILFNAWRNEMHSAPGLLVAAVLFCVMTVGACIMLISVVLSAREIRYYASNWDKVEAPERPAVLVIPESSLSTVLETLYERSRSPLVDAEDRVRLYRAYALHTVMSEPIVKAIAEVDLLNRQKEFESDADCGTEGTTEDLHSEG